MIIKINFPHLCHLIIAGKYLLLGADPTEKEVLKLTQLLDRHSVSNQERLASFYEFCSSEYFDPSNQKFLDLQAAVVQLDINTEVSISSHRRTLSLQFSLSLSA